MRKNLPIVAIMGRPNVGKSTLLNRLSSRMEAIVDSKSGITRDRKYITAQWEDRTFLIADTGGVGTGLEGLLSKEVERQAFIAAKEADLVIMVVDAKTGVTEDDLWLARQLKKLGKKTILAVNKVDSEQAKWLTSEFYSLGLGEPICISAYHGLGIGELLQKVCYILPFVKTFEEPEISIAIVGRPNVGKSSLLNKLAGEERALVHEKPHTTRDTIDTLINVRNKTYRIIDTAGMKSKKTQMDDIEYYSSIRTLHAIDEADIVLLILDAFDGPSKHDQRIAMKIDSKGKACLVLLNKWDLVKTKEKSDELMDSVKLKFRFATHLPILRISALTGRGIDKILPLVDEVYEQWRMRIPTPSLNSFLAEVNQKRPSARKGRKELKLYYATQVDISPPTIVIFVNDAKLVRPDLRRFLARQLRDRYGFWGSPLRIHFRTSGKKAPE